MFLSPALVSESEGMEKPSPSIFLAACERAMVGPHSALHASDELEA